MSAPLLEVRDLTIAYDDAGLPHRVVHGVSFDIAPGEVVALVGESGSGKTTIAQAVIGLLPGGGVIERGEIRLNGTDIARWSDKRLADLRGAVVSLVPQDPVTSLNPVRTIGAQVGEILRLHGERDNKAIRAKVLDLLARVGLSEPERRFDQYPHELSGGMRQRVLIAIAVALKPQLIIADEPTSALDVTVQKRILDLLDDLRREHGTALLFVTHDLGVAAERADRLIVLHGGRVQEEGPVAQLLDRPQAAYTQRLLADAPAFARDGFHRPAREGGEIVVAVEGLTQVFDGGAGPVTAVDGVSFTVARGTTHALVGESGSGKTTTLRALLGFQRPTGGTIHLNGTDLAGLRGDSLRRFRKTVQLVYQNPYSSLDPRQTVEAIIEEPLLNFDPVPKAERQARVRDILARVGLSEALLARRPAALSGGQRQRVAIARALILKPEIVVFDEAVSALDVTVQAQILALLDELQRDLGLTYVFVSHDLAVVRRIADTVSVLHQGRLVESGPVARVFAAPESPYTQALLAAIPGRRASAPA